MSQKMPPKEWHKAVMAMTYHFKQLLAGLLLYAATLPILLSEDGEDPMKEQMLQEMRLEVIRIAEEYGDIPFAQVYTNDRELGRVVKKNVKKLQSTIPLDRLIEERMQTIDTLNGQIAALKRLKNEAKDSLEQTRRKQKQHEEELEQAKRTLEALKKEIKPASQTLEIMRKLLRRYDIAISSNRDGQNKQGKDTSPTSDKNAGSIEGIEGYEGLNKVLEGGNSSVAMGGINISPSKSSSQKELSQSDEQRIGKQVIIDSDKDGNTRVRYQKL